MVVAELFTSCPVHVHRFDSHSGRSRVFLQALRDIAAGEELFVSYGHDYCELQRLFVHGAVMYGCCLLQEDSCTGTAYHC